MRALRSAGATFFDAEASDAAMECEDWQMSESAPQSQYAS